MIPKCYFPIFDQKQAILAQKQPKNVSFGSFYAIFGPF